MLRQSHMPQSSKNKKARDWEREKKTTLLSSVTLVYVRDDQTQLWLSYWSIVTILFELMKKKIYKMMTHHTHIQAKADADKNRNSCFEALLPFWWPWGFRERLRFASNNLYLLQCHGHKHNTTSERLNEWEWWVRDRRAKTLAHHRPFLWGAQKTFMISITS